MAKVAKGSSGLVGDDEGVANKLDYGTEYGRVDQIKAGLYQAVNGTIPLAHSPGLCYSASLMKFALKITLLTYGKYRIKQRDFWCTICKEV